jgi:shikimate kinase/3-dehydroquinate synthase
MGFMGAGKTTVGREVAARIGRPFIDLDREIERRHGPIPEIFRERGEEEFRCLEEQALAEALAGPDAVLALGGGAVLSQVNRARLEARAFRLFLDVDVETAWNRVRGSNRPLAQNEASFRKLYQTRQRFYIEFGDASAQDADGTLLAALRVVVPGGILVATPSVLIADESVLRLHPYESDERVLTVPPGEDAKSAEVAERLAADLDLPREGTILALGGGSTMDVAGFVAATYKRGLRWQAVPTTLTGMVDAAIGGKTGINTARGKNLIGAFHFPQSVVIQPRYLTTLPEEERRAGMAEVVKTGLLAGSEPWSRPELEMIRACAAFKCAVVLSDPYETEGRRTILNLGHTFAHALEAGSDYQVSHGDAVALGLLAALRLSGLDSLAKTVEDVLAPRPVRADPTRAWEAMSRDKKARGGSPRLVLLEAPGRPVTGVELPEADVRAALSSLIAS